jgi:two-component system sensor histidine kinase DesK
VHLLWLSYLAFLFVPWVDPAWDLKWLPPTLISIPLFLILFFAHDRARRTTGLWQPLSIGALGLALVPFNPWGNTYLIFASAFTPFALPGLARPLMLTGAMLVAYAIETVIIGQPHYALLITALVSTISCAGNYFQVEGRRKNAALKESREEIQRLAQVAERERIGRDLHDLLGHTLSLIVLKAELAGKLISRDKRAAASEIAEMEQIARDALKQVRTAVSGMRAAGLQGEIASARAILESSQVKTTIRQDLGRPLPAAVEIALAMFLREAATNIHRHAQAKHAEVDLRMDREGVRLTVTDDGRGGIIAHGNGLTGLAERLRSLGGSFEVDSQPGRGTTLRARLPLHSVPDVTVVEPAPLASP